MVNIRNVNDIILGLIDYFKLVQPDLDTKPGTVARDLFIEAPASQISLIYEELSAISDLQSIKLAAGADLDKLAKNYGITRNSSTPSTGTALLTFNSVEAPFAINVGDSVSTKTGLTFKVLYGVSITPSSANLYSSTATKFKNDLDFVGIKDQYAVEVTVQCSSPGTSGNIAKYYLSKSNITSVTGVTNVNSFTGGADQEGDAAFRNRVLALFNGSSVGTSLGYKSAALSTVNVQDALVIEPGDPLMTRDGTVVSTDFAGNKTIISEGQGGKVDVIVLGSNLIENVDSFIYQDKSNVNDPTNEKNDFVLGQISGDENKTINKKRIDNIKNNVLPSQPVNSIVSVTGSLSGPNFIVKNVDSLGRVSGNYELVKDTGVYAGSPWGFDKFKWVSNKISDFSQDLIKGQANGQDNLSYSDSTSIHNIEQNISITNENSLVTSDRSIIQLLHYPLINVTRVFNVNTGERYFVSDQNPDGTGTTNTTGRIKISGNTLPSPTDILQIDYTWIFAYDQYFDFYGKNLNNNIRLATDSVDWGYGSQIKNEKILFSKNATSDVYSGQSSHPVSSVVSCSLFTQVDGIVSDITSGIYIGRKLVQLTNLISPISSIQNIYIKNTYVDVYTTAEGDGNFTNVTSTFGSKIVYTVNIVLPSDTVAVSGQKVTAIFNSTDVYTTSLLNGSFNGNLITIPLENLPISVSSLADNLYLNVSYIANVLSFSSSATSLLPISRSANGFLFNNLGFINNTPFNNLKRESKLVQKNLSNQYYVDLDVDINNFSLEASNILSIIKISNGLIFWDEMHPGTITFNSSNNKYQLILSGYNSPATSDQVIIFYYSNNTNKYQPISYYNEIIKTKQDQVLIDGLNQYYINIDGFIDNPGPLTFEIFDPATNILQAQVTDGYLSYNPSQPHEAVVGSPTVDIVSFVGTTNYKLRVYDENNFNNSGIYDITGVSSGTNELTVGLDVSNISPLQISIIRLSDNKEIWNNEGIIDYTNNKLILPSFASPALSDKVFVLYYKYNNLRISPTNISSNVFDPNTSSGSITVSGTTIKKIEDVVFTSTSSGLTVNFLEAVMKGLSYSSTASIPSSLKLARITKLEKVQTSGNSDEVVDVVVEYDLINSKIRSNYYSISELIENASLDRFTLTLPSTVKNTTSTSEFPYLPTISDKLRCTIYVVNESDTETLNYTSPGTLYTNKKFCLINKAYVSSGFKSNSSASLTLNNNNQPTFGSRYKVYYDYTAPKPNERITINYNFNQTISNTTFNVEKSRPINADVLVKQANAILVDVTMNIVVQSAYVTSSSIVSQNVKDALISSINLNSLGGTIDGSDLVNSAYSITGVDRSRIIYFNKNGVQGQALSLVAQNNEYFVANNVIVNVETR